MNKEFQKKTIRAAARFALYFFVNIFRWLPLKLVQGANGVIIFIGYRLTRRHRRVAMESLEVALGKEKTPQELQRICKNCFENLGRGMVELMYFIEHPSLIKAHVSFEGLHHVEAALKEGKGIIGVTAHFGNFPLMLIRFAQEGYKTSAIIRSTRDENIEKYFLATRARLGLNTIYSQPRTECVNQSLKTLRNNELLFIPMDQNSGSKAGVFVDFFGQKAGTPTGPVVFAMRTGAPLLPVFTVRQQGAHHKVIIEPPFHLQIGKDDQETIFINTARITKIIENYIRRYPQEWGWMHRRWKSRPKEETIDEARKAQDDRHSSDV